MTDLKVGDLVRLRQTFEISQIRGEDIVTLTGETYSSSQIVPAVEAVLVNDVVVANGQCRRVARVDKVIYATKHSGFITNIERLANAVERAQYMQQEEQKIIDKFQEKLSSIDADIQRWQEERQKMLREHAEEMSAWKNAL